MTRYQLDFSKMINWLLPRFKRKPVRLAWLYAVTVKLRQIHTDFISTGESLSALARVNSQVINLENYLVTRIGAGIEIEPQVVKGKEAFVADNDDDGFYVGVSENDPPYWVSDGDDYSTINVIVKVPAVLDYDPDELKAILDKYKVPGSTYLIVEI